MEGDISLQLPTGSAASSRSLRKPEAPAIGEFAEAVLAGLARNPRSVPCRFFYDARGSELFEEITKLPEYYPTRVETALLEAHGEEIAALAGEERILVEFGSGSSRKTSLLLSALGQVPAYIPIDIAAESLREAAEWLSGRHPGLTILPLIADFTATRALPARRAAEASARLLLRLDHRQSDTCGGAGLPWQCRAPAWPGQRLSPRRGSEEERADSRSRL